MSKYILLYKKRKIKSYEIFDLRSEIIAYIKENKIDKNDIIDIIEMHEYSESIKKSMFQFYLN